MGKYGPDVPVRTSRLVVTAVDKRTVLVSGGKPALGVGVSLSLIHKGHKAIVSTMCLTAPLAWTRESATLSQSRWEDMPGNSGREKAPPHIINVVCLGWLPREATGYPASPMVCV